MATLLTAGGDFILVLTFALLTFGGTNMSAVSRTQDRHGNDLHYGDGGDVWFFPSNEINDFRDHLRKIRNFELRDGDVILAAFPRSGTHWHHQLIRMLMLNTKDTAGQIWKDHMDWFPVEKIDRPDSPRLLVTHLNRFELLPKQVKEKKVKVIYSYRNPKDTWVSFYNFSHDMKFFPAYKGTWPEFFDLMIDTGYNYGDWFDHVLNWEKAAGENPDRIFLSCFELMKKDTVGQTLKLNQFLGLNRDKGLCEEIAKACQFSNLTAAKKIEYTKELGEQAWEIGMNVYYRKGEIGDWKNWFTVAQSERLDAVFEKRMSGSKLPFFFQ